MRKVRKFCAYGKFHNNVRLTAFDIMVRSLTDCRRGRPAKKCLAPKGAVSVALL